MTSLTQCLAGGNSRRWILPESGVLRPRGALVDAGWLARPRAGSASADAIERRLVAAYRGLRAGLWDRAHGGLDASRETRTECRQGRRHVAVSLPAVFHVKH